MQSATWLVALIGMAKSAIPRDACIEVCRIIHCPQPVVCNSENLCPGLYHRSGIVYTSASFFTPDAHEPLDCDDAVDWISGQASLQRSLWRPRPDTDEDRARRTRRRLANNAGTSSDLSSSSSSSSSSTGTSLSNSSSSNNTPPPIISNNDVVMAEAAPQGVTEGGSTTVSAATPSGDGIRGIPPSLELFGASSSSVEPAVAKPRTTLPVLFIKPTRMSTETQTRLVSEIRSILLTGGLVDAVADFPLVDNMRGILKETNDRLITPLTELAHARITLDPKTLLEKSGVRELKFAAGFMLRACVNEERIHIQHTLFMHLVFDLIDKLLDVFTDDETVDSVMYNEDWKQMVSVRIGLPHYLDEVNVMAGTKFPKKMIHHSDHWQQGVLDRCPICAALEVPPAEAVLTPWRHMVIWGDLIMNALGGLVGGLTGGFTDELAQGQGISEIRAQEHWLEYLEVLGALMRRTKALDADALGSREHICQIHAVHVVNMVGKWFGHMKKNYPIKFEEVIQRNLFLLMRTCPNFIGQHPNSARNLVLTSTHFDATLSSTDIPKPRIERVPQDLAAASQLLSTVLSQAGDIKKWMLTKADYAINVQFENSHASGPGPLRWLVENIVKAALQEDQNLFRSITTGSRFVIPVGGNQNTLNNLRSLGKFIGIGISQGINMRIPLAPQCLRFFRLTNSALMYEGASLLDALMADHPAVLALFEQTNPDKARSFKDELSAKVWMGEDFPLAENRRFSNADDSERQAFLLEHAQYDIVASIYEPMMALMRGIYDAIPFPQLSYYTDENLSDLFSVQDAPIDIQDLKRSTVYSTYVADARVAVASHVAVRVPVIRWFWEILETEYSQERLSEFLDLVSANKYPPMGGFTGYDHRATWLNVEFGLPGNHPPRTHTCVRQIHLHSYRTKVLLREALNIAMANISFGTLG